MHRVLMLSKLYLAFELQGTCLTIVNRRALQLRLLQQCWVDKVVLLNRSREVISVRSDVVAHADGRMVGNVGL